MEALGQMLAENRAAEAAKNFTPFVKEFTILAAQMSLRASQDTGVLLGNWCPLILLPRGYFEREIIETLDILGPVCLKAVSDEILRIDFNEDRPVGVINCVRPIVRNELLPLLECFGGILQDTPEGFVILCRNIGDKPNRHSAASLSEAPS
jgi:hypothetical protein